MASGGQQRQQNMSYWDQQARQSQQQIQQVDPLEQEWRDRQMRFMTWDKSKGKNVADAPGLEDYIQIGRAAQDRAKQDRFGTGALQLADTGGQKPFLENLKSMRAAEAGERFGTGLEEALAARRAEASGSVMPLSQLRTNRNIASAGNASGMFGQWSNVRTGPSWWQMLLQGASSAASAYAGNPNASI